MKPTDVRPVGVSLYFIPVQTRVPLKFGPETLTSVTVARVRLTVENRKGQRASGWGETPLSVQWVWPGGLSYQYRHSILMNFCRRLGQAWVNFNTFGHALEVGHAFQKMALANLHAYHNQQYPREEAMPWLAALVCCSPFDLALHDAYGNINAIDTYQTYNARFLNQDLSSFLEPAFQTRIDFRGKYPADFLEETPPSRLAAWHLVGGLDPLEPIDLTGEEPADGYPVLLDDWIVRDGLTCLKVKLRGNDFHWDYDRLVRVGHHAIQSQTAVQNGGVQWLTADFNCTVTDPRYVTEILDRLVREYPRIYGMLLYVEQPFPYDLEHYQIDVHSVSARKPLFMDESAHDWQLIRLGRHLGWTGVALKTCKTQTGALLSLCWAKAHGMTLMVQDLTNPMLAQIPHVRLAAHAGTIMGVESNAMQFYPEASVYEAKVHPGLYQRRHGALDLSSLSGPGFGYRLDEIQRSLPVPETWGEEG